MTMPDRAIIGQYWPEDSLVHAMDPRVKFILSFVPEKEILFGKSGLLGKGAGILPVQYPEVTGMFFPVTS